MTLSRLARCKVLKSKKDRRWKTLERIREGKTRIHTNLALISLKERVAGAGVASERVGAGASVNTGVRSALVNLNLAGAASVTSDAGTRDRAKSISAGVMA
jgi:hypothetical protein